MKYVMDTGVLSLFYASSISTFRAYIGPVEVWWTPCMANPIFCMSNESSSEKEGLDSLN